jgi:hypothetical protein
VSWNLVRLDENGVGRDHLILLFDGSERQIIKDMDGTIPRAKIKACSICDPYVLIIREDDTIGLFIDAQRGRVRRKDMSPMGDKVDYVPLYSDIYAHMRAQRRHVI